MAASSAFSLFLFATDLTARHQAYFFLTRIKSEHMKRTIPSIAITVLLLIATGKAPNVHEAQAGEQRNVTLELVRVQPSAKILKVLGMEQQSLANQQCCKICTVGKACGNTCIAVDRVCHVGPGCACNG
jgi:hypothetical protein